LIIAGLFKSVSMPFISGYFDRFSLDFFMHDP